jgi:hypothetical protein
VAEDQRLPVHYAPTEFPLVVGLDGVDRLLGGARVVAAGEISLDIDPEPLAKVEQVWPQAGSDRRIVFVP